MSPVGGRGGDTVFGVSLRRTRIASLRSHVRESFGKVVMAMMMLPRYRQQTLADLQHLVLEPLIRDRGGIAAAVWVETLQQHRVTLLPGVLERTRHTVCLVAGADKKEALRSVLKGPVDLMLRPAQIRSFDMSWYFDQAAAGS